MNRILIVEDDTALSNGISLALKDENCSFVQAFDYASAKEQLKSSSFNLVILDINLPDRNGLDLLNEIRSSSNLPVIILTANDLETDIVTGFQLGADDYITKPFSLMVLRARVSVQLRKDKQKSTAIIKIDDFCFSFDKMEFSKNGLKIELSKTEQKLLHILIENKGNTITRQDLLDKIWGDGTEFVEENALSVTIKRLRDKLEDNPSIPRYIKTIYGIGYTWTVN